MAENIEVRLPSTGVTKRFGITRRTLDRWMRHPDLNSPKPLVINNRLYFSEAEVKAWEIDCARKRAADRQAA